MSDDIVERLRYWNPVTFPLVAQAADEIERLRARLGEAVIHVPAHASLRIQHLEARLAGAEALLREAREMIDRNMNHFINMPPAVLVTRIDAFLSGTAP